MILSSDRSIGIGGCSDAILPYFACQYICQLSIVLINVIWPMKLRESFICLQIGLKRNLFVDELGLCTPPTIFVSFALVIRRLVHMKVGGLLAPEILRTPPTIFVSFALVIRHLVHMK